MIRPLHFIFSLILFMGVNNAYSQKFSYKYKGINFNCIVKNGRTFIIGFDSNAEKVLIPSKVNDGQGRIYQVSAIDLYDESTKYKTSTVAIEQGILEIDEYCFSRFSQLTDVLIPNSVKIIGRKAFNKKQKPLFRLPQHINEADLIAGIAIRPDVDSNLEDTPLSNMDLASYLEESEKKSEEKSAVTIAQAPKNDENEESSEDQNQSIAAIPGSSDIDFSIPASDQHRENTFCLIIANEKYTKKDTPGVKFAAQDGETFKNYCIRTLGIPDENITMNKNCTYLQMRDNIRWLNMIAENYSNEASFIIYFAGHGVPDEKGNCMLMPADVSINDVNNGFSLRELYTTLGKLTSKSALVLIDACFSGNTRDDVTALNETHRGIVHNVRKEQASGNVVVLSATSNTETALSYDEKAHGLFSYYVMKKLQETKGEVTFGELYDYVNQEVTKKSVVTMRKKQTPSVNVSNNLKNTWREIKL